MLAQSDEKVAIENQIKLCMQSYDYDTTEYPVGVIIEMYQRSLDFLFLEEEQNTGDIIYIPDYQREFVWTDERQSKFIESMIIGVPIPYLFLADISGNMEVVDGSQRLRTLYSFIVGDLKLKGLKQLTLLNGKKFNDLPLVRQKRFRSKSIRAILLGEKTTSEARYDLFERLNTGSDELKPAEIRKGAFAGPFADFLSECAEEELFKKLCPVSVKVGLRQENTERVLRFFAYSASDPIVGYRGTVSPFLDTYMKGITKTWNADIEREMKAKFLAMLNFVDQNFPYGFRKFEGANSTPRVRFEAISVGVANAIALNPDLSVNNVEWIDSDEFHIQTRSDAANNKSKLVGRIDFVKNKLLGI
ncbi:DUF262 domain-containing protein [Shewanella baltica]|uniref:DUF262 domain-containing protein n=1 Tax=Shewanella baltica TaxID=62322 RepID=UPI000E01FF25|nr:DUF262 domain-containing protein [Shewanella baltica]MCS6236171.1 DUF262 domain-containing protein [Shewanella baltica]MCS6270716.1 DUF262 domain-containing protein [Shewanella baltica]SUI79478.1 Uncharacterized conserved protein [Shewanella baltica]